MIALYKWRARFEAYAEEICEMFEACAQSMDRKHIDLEIREAWQILYRSDRDLSKMSVYSREYPRKIWSDTIARRMGWLHHRVHLPEDLVRQRLLEAAGQLRILGA